MSEMAPTARNPLARKLAVDLSVMTVIGVMLALIGPFGTFQQPLAFRFITWLLFAYIGYAIYTPMGYFVGRLEERLALPRFGLWVAAVLLATVPMSVIVWVMGSGAGAGGLRMPSLETGLTHYFYVLVIGAGVTLVFETLQKRPTTLPIAADPVHDRQPPLAGESAAAMPLQPRFLDRLPPALGSELIALEMEDHYVRAHTMLGSELVLMRLRDAMAELDGIDGEQVHRSWWVARHAVEDVKRDGRNIRLVLETGLEAPVSRANVAVLKECGWF